MIVCVNPQARDATHERLIKKSKSRMQQQQQQQLLQQQQHTSSTSQHSTPGSSPAKRGMRGTYSFYFLSSIIYEGMANISNLGRTFVQLSTLLFLSLLLFHLCRHLCHGIAQVTILPIAASHPRPPPSFPPPSRRRRRRRTTSWGWRLAAPPLPSSPPPPTFPTTSSPPTPTLRQATLPTLPPLRRRAAAACWCPSAPLPRPRPSRTTSRRTTTREEAATATPPPVPLRPPVTKSTCPGAFPRQVRFRSLSPPRIPYLLSSFADRCCCSVPLHIHPPPSASAEARRYFGLPFCYPQSTSVVLIRKPPRCSSAPAV